MEKVVNLSILRVLLTILLSLASLLLNTNFSTILAFILILTVGLLHGSNDLLIIKKVAALEYTNRWVFIKSIALYLAAIGVILLAFYANRAYALLFFVLISSYHFGQQHLALKWHTTATLPLKLVAYVFYGLGIFGMIFATHADTAANVISAITAYEVKAIQFNFLTLVSIIGFYLVSWFNKSFRAKDYLFETALFLLLLSVFLITDLLLSFALYFAFWHALPSLGDQIKLLYQQPLGKGLISYIRSSFIYWVISSIAFVVLLMVLDIQDLEVIELLVYFLAAITFPHVLIMSRIESLLES